MVSIRFAMGRKKGKKASSGAADPSFSAASSRRNSWDLAAASTSDRGQDDDHDVFTLKDNPLEFITEALFEKRAATREQALVSLVEYLRSSHRWDECEQWKETLGQRLLHSLKKGKGKETALAATALALVVVTLGVDTWTEALVQDALPVLLASLRKGKETIRAAGILCFVATEDSVVLQKCIEQVHKASSISTSSSVVRTEAYMTLALLISVSVPRQETLDVVETFVEGLTRALGDESIDVRAAAGNALVVIREVFGEILQQEVQNEGGDEDDSQISSPSLSSKFSQMACTSWNDDSTGKRMNKRDRANQRRAFRSLLEAMEEDGGTSSSSDSKIKLKHGDVLVLDTQSLRVTAQVFKSLLAQGFQVHMQNNDLLHQIFNFVPRQEKIHLSQLEKKMMFSPNSAAKKKQTKERNRGRMQKNTIQQRLDDFYDE